MNNLFVLTGQEEEEDEYGWYDMPEFIQPENKPYDEIYVTFETEEDMIEFANLIGQPESGVPSKRMKGIWYPKLVRGAQKDWRFVSEDDKKYFNCEEIVL